MKHTTSALVFLALTMNTACVLTGTEANATAQPYQPVNMPNANSGAARAADGFAKAQYCAQNPQACNPPPANTPTSVPAQNGSTPVWTLGKGTLVADQCFGECSVADGDEQNVVVTIESTGIRRTGFAAGDAIPYFRPDDKTYEWSEQRDAGTTCAGATASIVFTADTDGNVRKSVYKEGHCQLAPRRCLCVYVF